jgi:hypothetical protein
VSGCNRYDSSIHLSFSCIFNTLAGSIDVTRLLVLVQIAVTHQLVNVAKTHLLLQFDVTLWWFKLPLHTSWFKLL